MTSEEASTAPRPRLELGPLRLLVGVAETHSIGAAARREQISQPSASKSLATLERTLGVPLLVRTPQGSTLTANGRAIADWARRVVDASDDLLGAVAAMREAHAGDLRVAASMTVAEHLVPLWLSQLRQLSPDLHIGLTVANSQQVQEMVASGHADLGFVETPHPDTSLAVSQVGRDELVVVVAPGHPLASAGSLTPGRLAAEPLIVREAGSGTRETLDALLGSERVEPLLELGSNAAIRGAVVAGAGAAVLSRLAVQSELAAGNLVAVPVTGIDLHRPLCAVRRRRRRLSPAGETLLTLATRP